MVRLRLVTSIATIVALSCGTTVFAADEESDIEKIGVAAALGLSAADGKTSLGTGAGAVEAALLESDAINQAGAIIVALARRGGATSDTLLLTRSETINTAAYVALRQRLAAVEDYVSRVQCPSRAKKDDAFSERLKQMLAEGDGEGGHKGRFSLRTTDGKLVKLSVGDIVPAVATSTSFAAINLPVEDRAILTAILINRTASLRQSSGTAQPSGGLAPAATPFEPATWTKVEWGAPGGSLGLKLPAEVQGDPENSDLLDEYNAMLEAADRLRHCTDDSKAKAAVATADAFAQSITAVTDKAPVAPLSLAVQQESLYTSGAPNILRIAVETSGGTSRTRSGLIYTFGAPGAAVVSAGLVVSFRLIDTEVGVTKYSGVVRCAVRPANMGAIERFARADEVGYGTKLQKQKATCSYIAG